MSTLLIRIHNIKNIKDAQIEIPFDNGIYTIVGSNGCGKSTLMLCMAQLLSNQLSRLAVSDAKTDSFVEFEVDGNESIWRRSNTPKWQHFGKRHKYNGLYEGSLFYGTRFEDSTNIERMIENGRITEHELADADDYVKDKMSYIYMVI